MTKLLMSLAVLTASAVVPLFGQQLDVKGTVLERLKGSEEFTLKVADAMPAADYGYKLTPEQKSFGWQITHLAQAMAYFTSAFSGAKPDPGKPASDSKADVIAFVKSQYEKTISLVSNLTPEQMAKNYKSDEGSANGLALLMAMSDHTAHHRACAEMYLRAKGITPPKYMD